MAWSIEIREWKLEVGDWRLEIGDWRLTVGNEVRLKKGEIVGRDKVGGEDVRDDLGFEMGEVVKRVAVAGLGEVNEADEPAGADEDVFEVEVAVDGGLRADDVLVEERREAGERGRQAQHIKPP